MTLILLYSYIHIAFLLSEGKKKNKSKAALPTPKLPSKDSEAESAVMMGGFCDSSDDDGDNDVTPAETPVETTPEPKPKTAASKSKAGKNSVSWILPPKNRY